MTGSFKKIPAAACCGCVALLLFAAGCSETKPVDTRAADESMIRDLDAQWSKTAGARDVDGSVAYYSDDATLMPPNAPAATGKQAIHDAWAAMLAPGVSVSWQISKIEVARAGDLAYVVGAYSLTQKDARGRTMTDQGKLVEVWKKQTDAKWRVVADIYNSDLPAAKPREKEKAAKAKKPSHGKKTHRSRAR